MKNIFKFNSSWSESVFFLIAACLGIILLLVFPFAAFCLYLSLMVLIGSECSVRPFSVVTLCVTAVVVLAPLVALKLPVNIVGNDKSQYLEFMREMNSFGIKDLIEWQPEVISFISLYIASSWVGATDLAFLIIFLAFFSLLLWVIWREQYRVIPLFMLLLICSSPFFSVYGNVIRQGMALPFIFAMIFSDGKKKAAIWLILSGLAHIPALLIGLPYVLYRCIGKWATWIASMIAVGILTLMRVRPGFLNSLGGDDSSYISRKVDLYNNWDKYSIAGVAALAFSIFLFCNIIGWRERRRTKYVVEGGCQTEARCLIALNMSFLSLLTMYDFAKIFERIYIYFFVVALMYLSLVINRMKPGLSKAVVILVVMVYGFAALTKNMIIQPLLYRGDPFGFLTASIFEMYRHFM